jgi:phenylacetate-CoA ligase
MILPVERVRGLITSARYPRLKVSEVRAFQDRRLRALVRHAYENVPFYRALYDEHGIDPQSIRGVEDLHRLPITHRQIFQSLPLEQRLVRGTDQRRLIVRKTSGSSGQPLAICRTWMEERSLGLLRWRAMFDSGYRPTDRYAGVLMNHKLQSADVQLPLRMLRAAGVLRMQMIDCVQEPKAILDALRVLDPQFIGGFPGVLARVAVLASATAGPPLRPRLLVTGGETITPLMRKQIEQNFAAPLFDTYGSVEFNLIAWQCREGGAMHTCDDGVIAEVLAPDGTPVPAGGRGELVGTNLHSFAMPFIRYRMGDVVTRGDDCCSCGTPFGSIASIQGRMIDHFLLPGGRVLHPWELMTDLVNPNIVREYQLLQESESRVLLRIVPQRSLSEAEVRALREPMERILGRLVTFELRLVDRIPLEVTGKFRSSRSLVHSAYDNFSSQPAEASVA